MFFALLKKEMHCLFRAKQWPVSVLLFGFVLVVLASFAFRRIGYGQLELLQLTPGILWIIFLFCGLVSLNYSFFHEEEFGALNGLLLTPCDPALIFLSKFIANCLFLLGVTIFFAAAHSVLFGVSLEGHFLELCGVLALVSVGFCSLGTLFAAMSVSVRGRELVLPLLLFPLSLPLISAGLHLSNEILGAAASPATQPWLLLAVGFDVIALTLSTVLFEFVVRE